MISSAAPVIPTINGMPHANGNASGQADPLHVLSSDAITRAVSPPHSYVPQVLAGSVVVSSAGAAALVGYIVHEHFRAKTKAARAKAAHAKAARACPTSTR